MPKKINKIFFFILILSSFLFFQGFEKPDFNNMFFEVIDSRHGLSNSSISSIVQDSRGFLWFSTQNGLNRYDGTQFLRFNKEPFNKNSIPNQLIQTMYMDKNDILWLGTYNGLCRFDIAKGEFTNYSNIKSDESSLSNDIVIAIERDTENNLWVGTLKGLNLFDEKKQKFKRISFDKKEQGPLKDSTIRDIFKDKDGNLWIGTYDGIYRYFNGKWSFYNAKENIQIDKYIKKDKTDSIFNIKPFTSNLPAANPSMVFIEDNNGDIWVGLWGFGLCKYEKSSSTFKNFPLPFNKIYSLLFIDSDNIFVGTWGDGLYNFNVVDNSFTKVENRKLGLTLPNNTIYSLFKDKGGIIWIGTHGAGVIKWVKNKPDLVYLKHNTDPSSLNQGNSIPYSKIKDIFEDSYGNIWLGTYNDGLVKYNPENNDIVIYNSNDKRSNSISDNIVRDIFQDSLGNLWIATNKFLNLYDYKTDKFIYFKKSDFGIENTNEDTFTSVIEDKEQRLIIGTYLSGLIIVPLSKEKGKYFNLDGIKVINTNTNPSISDDLIYKIYIDDKDNIWVGTNKGLNLIDKDFTTIKKYLHEDNNLDTISHDTITDIYQDSKGEIWVATSNGLNIYDYINNKFKHLTTNDGLPDNYINSIIESNDGIILFTTFNNLVKYNRETSEFICYDYYDGLLTKEFSSGVCKLKNGAILFGGIGIVNIIKDKSLIKSNFNPEIQIVSFKVEGKEYKENNIYYDLDEIELPYYQNSISIKFVSLDYSSPESLLYSYKIDKLNKKWQYLGREASLNLVNLKSGTYKIYLRGTNGDGIYSDHVKLLKVKINTPFYLSWWAILIYSFLLFSLISLTILLLREKALSEILIERKNLIEERKQFLEEEIKKEKEIEKNLIESKESLEELNKAKDTFIAQISHEFKNPLSLIYGYIQILEKNENDNYKKQLIKNMNSIIKHILGMITTILDLARINLNKMQPNFSMIDFHQFLHELVDSFKIIAQEKKLDFEFYFDENLPNYASLDEVKTRQILSNLISNAIKYTEIGFVRFEAKVIKTNQTSDNSKSMDIIFNVIDSGYGLTEKEKENIFETFYRGQDGLKEEGTGLGLPISKKLAELINGQILVESEKGVGSKFTLLLKEVKI